MKRRSGNPWLPFALLAAAALSGCRYEAGARDENPVPGDWFQLPEDGGPSRAGSLPHLGATTERLLAAQSRALESLPAKPDGRPGDDASRPHGKPADWVPWHLAAVTTDFAVTGEGLFGALLFEGTAAVQAIWMRSGGTAAAAPRSGARKSAPDVTIQGTATSAQVARQLEPAIRAALSTGTIRDERALRATVTGAAENFRALAGRLATLRTGGARFRPTGFRVEIGVDAQGQLTPLVGVGGAVGFRFDWLKGSDPDRPRTDDTKRFSPDLLTRKLEAFVNAIAPDLDAAAKEAERLEESGFALEAIRVGLGISADYDFGIATGSADFIGALQFGSDGDDCRDPDADGDCRPDSSKAISPGEPEELRLIASGARTKHVEFADREGIAYQVLKSANAPGDQVVYRIKHAKFQAGLRKAVGMAGFFARHAGGARPGSWLVRELETEFALSVTGTLGLATVGGQGEVELEFINQRK